MKRYHLDVITGIDRGIKTYEVEADGYDYSGSGCYTFWIRNNESRWQETIAVFPIHRTIIKRIEEV